MSKLGVSQYPDEIVFPDYLVDASGRLRVSNPRTLFDTQNQYNDSPVFWENLTVGSGSTAHVPLKSGVNLSVSAASGDKVIRQSRQYFRYNPGKSHLIYISSVMAPTKANLKQQKGYGDANNAVFLQQLGSEVSFVVRSGVTGLPVETKVTQDNWEIDKMNDAGSSDEENKSGINLDLTKEQLIVIDLTWLSAGLVRCGFVIQGRPVYVTEFKHANILDVPYMSTANLPLMYSIENVGETDSPSTMLAICATVISEGGSDLEGLDFGGGTEETGVSVTARVPIFSIRHALKINSIENRGQSIIQHLDLLVTGQDAYFELVYGGSLTGANFVAVGGNSMMEIDTSSSAISGGDSSIIGYVAAGNGTVAGQTGKAVRSKRRLGLNIAGTVADIVTLVATRAATSGTAVVFAGGEWIEFY